MPVLSYRAARFHFPGFPARLFLGGERDPFCPGCSLSIPLPCLPVQETFQVHLFFSLDHPLSPLSACPFHSCWLVCPPPAWTPFSLRAVTLIFSNSVAPCPSVSSDFPLSIVFHSLRIFSAGLTEKVCWWYGRSLTCCSSGNILSLPSFLKHIFMRYVTHVWQPFISRHGGGVAALSSGWHCFCWNQRWFRPLLFSVW